MIVRSGLGSRAVADESGWRVYSAAGDLIAICLHERDALQVAAALVPASDLRAARMLQPAG